MRVPSISFDSFHSQPEGGSRMDINQDLRIFIQMVILGGSQGSITGYVNGLVCIASLKMAFDQKVCFIQSPTSYKSFPQSVFKYIFVLHSSLAKAWLKQLEEQLLFFWKCVTPFPPPLVLNFFIWRNQPLNKTNQLYTDETWFY